MKFFYLIGCNLKRKKLRSLLTLFSIAIAFLLYGYLSAIKVALSGGVDVAGADRLIVRHKVSLVQMLPESYKARITRIPGVSLATHASWFGGIYQKPSNFFPQMAVEPETYLALYPEFVLSAEQKEKWFRTKDGALVGQRTAERFGWKIGDRIPIQATIWTKKGGSQAWEFEVCGIYSGAKEGTDTTQFLFRYDYFDKARAFSEGEVGWYIVKVSNPDQSDEIARQIDREFANSRAETKAETEGAFVAGFAQQIGDIGAIMKAVLGAVFFTILLVAGNTMAQSVRERTGELGVLKSLGFNNEQVLLMVLAESLLMSVLGGALGLGIAWALISRGDPTNGALPMFYLPVDDLLRGFLLTAILGLVTGILPAWQAMRLQIAEALRRI